MLSMSACLPLWGWHKEPRQHLDALVPVLATPHQAASPLLMPSIALLPRMVRGARSAPRLRPGPARGRQLRPHLPCGGPGVIPAQARL